MPPKLSILKCQNQEEGTLFKITVSWKKFSYTTGIVDFDTGEYQRQPMLEVKILPALGFLPFNTRMLVDSGAAETLLDAQIGEAIGLDVYSGKALRVGGITGSATGYSHLVQIELVGLKDILSVNVIFVPKMGASGLLGQVDFFSKYNVCFEQSKNIFSVEKVRTISF